MSLALKLIKTYFKVGSAIAPKATAKRGFKVFQKVRIKSIRKREEAFFEEGMRFVVPGKYEQIECFEFGNPEGELTLLVHGWESNAGCMTKFTTELADSGHRVVAFNLPGHAQYEKSSTNLLQCFVSMGEVLDYLNPSEPFNVISHSFGSAVMSNALSRSKYAVNRLVILTSPRRIEDIFLEFKGIVSMGDKAYQSMLDHTEKLLGEPLSNLDVDYNLNKVDYNELLLIHDKHDRILPYDNSEKIFENTSNSKLITLEKIGHYKMLWSDDVVKKAVSFVCEKEEIGATLA